MQFTSFTVACNVIRSINDAVTPTVVCCIIKRHCSGASNIVFSSISTRDGLCLNELYYLVCCGFVVQIVHDKSTTSGHVEDSVDLLRQTDDKLSMPQYYLPILPQKVPLPGEIWVPS